MFLDGGGPPSLKSERACTLETSPLWYTTIPHKALLKAVKMATKEAFKFAADRENIPRDKIALCSSATECVWVRANRSSYRKDGHTLKREDLSNLVEFLVSNTFVTFGQSIFEQKIGIPMGTNCAPDLANLFLYYYESRYISRVKITNGIAFARSFHMTFRLIDDVLSIDNPHLLSAVSKSVENGGIYPAELKLNQTSTSLDAVEFLGMTIRADERRFRLAVYDKRKSFPFLVRRYPLMSSLIPRTIPFGVFSGQLHRGYRICSGHEDFLTHALEVATVLLGNGCGAKKLKTVFKSFVHQHVNKYTKTRGNLLTKEFGRKLGNM